jgi:hypothetical protein
VAAYLRVGADERPPADKILERLALPQAAPVIPTKPPAPVVVAPKQDDRKLEALTKAAAPMLPPDKPGPAAEEKPVDLSKADEKLSSLLGKKS